MLRFIARWSLRIGVLVAVIFVIKKILDAQQEEPAPIRLVEAPAPKEEWVEPRDGVCPTTHPIKAKLGSRVFRKPGMSSYDASKPDRCYASEEAALHAGFRQAQR